MFQCFFYYKTEIQIRCNKSNGADYELGKHGPVPMLRQNSKSYSINISSIQ